MLKKENKLVDKFKIPEGRMSDLEDRLLKVNKVCVKLDLAPWVLTVHETLFKPDPQNQSAKIKYFSVTLTGETPKLNGWELAGKIEQAPNSKANLLLSVPGFDLPPLYQHKDHYCDHCQSARSRKVSYVVHKEGGEYKEVGSNCLKDFLGHRSAESLILFYTYLREIAEDTWEPGSGPSISYESLVDLLAFTARVIEREGYFKADSEKATSGVIFSLFVPVQGSKARAEQNDLREHYEPTVRNRETAAKAIEWVRVSTDPSNYMHNLRTLMAEDDVPLTKLGFLVSSVQAYLKEMGLAVQRAAKIEKSNLHVGTIGERSEFTLMLTRIREVNSSFGVTTIHAFEDEAGNAFTWFASARDLSATQDYNEFFKVKATVKKHDEYQGRNQTVLTRVVLLKQENAK